MELLTWLVVGPAIAIGIAYAGWRGKLQKFGLEQYGIVCIVSGVAAPLLLMFAQWMKADVRTPQYFLQLSCVLRGGLLFGVFMGCGFSVLFQICGIGTRRPG